MTNEDWMKMMVRGYTWKARMSNDAVFEFWTPRTIDRLQARKELLKIANGDYTDVYDVKDLKQLWVTR